VLKKEDPDNRILALLRHRDQEMALRKEKDSPEISSVSILPSSDETKKIEKPRRSIKEVLQELEDNYQPVQDYFTMVDNIFFDELAGNLSSSSQVVYLHLYRLSHGWNKPYCKVGRKTLNERTNMSKSTIKRAIKELKDGNYIQEIYWDNDGTIFQVLLPREVLSVVKMTIPKMDIVKLNTLEEDGMVKMDIPKMSIVKMTTPEEHNGHKDSNGMAKMDIPKMSIVKMTTPEEHGISNLGIVDLDIAKMTTPEEHGLVNLDIVKMTTPEENQQNSDSEGVVNLDIVKFNPNKYNIYKNTLSKNMGENKTKIPTHHLPSEREITEVIENFYEFLNQKASSEKKKKGCNEIKKLLNDGYDFSEIKFAAHWVAMGKSGAPPNSFTLVLHCIDQALKEREKKEKEKIVLARQKEEEEKKLEEEMKLWEQQRDEGVYLDEYYKSLGEEEQKALEKEAVEDLPKTNPHANNKNLSYMRDLLIKMKIREIVRKKFFLNQEK